MSIQYALLKGKVVGGMRAEVAVQKVNDANLGNGKYQSNHFHILVEAAGEVWRCPVNVKSVDNSEVWFKIRDTFRDHPILNELPNIPEGLLELPQRRPGRTLDFIREPLFDRMTMRHLPKNMPGDGNDIQDHLELYVKQAQAEPGAIVYVFGSFWRNEQFPPDKILNTRHGVHDVHMNQGNDNSHRGDDGVYQDGGVIFYYPQTDRYVGAFLAFNSQVWFTDNQSGHRLPGHEEGPLAEGGAEPVPQPQEGEGIVRIIAALVNPEGDDVGKETVTLFNATTSPVNLDGWKLIDRQNKVENLSGKQISGNEALTLRLSGKGVQLSNKGGAIRLCDRNEKLV
ncbi:MAG: DUF2278 family protein, partial [Chlorobiales bacterium]|nr:DUF2278 family protein [Chlorobiales bacterium]